MSDKSELMFRTTIVENGIPKEIIARLYDNIDSVPLFCSNEITGYKIITSKGLGNILVVNTDMLEMIRKISNRLINTLVWHMIFQISSGMYKKDYKIKNDYLVDNMVANICGKEDTLKLLKFIKVYCCENEEQHNIIDKRIQYIESKTKMFSELSYDIDKISIIDKANFAYLT